MKKIIFLFIISISLLSCNNEVSIGKLAKEVKSDINIHFSKIVSVENINYSINSFDLTHKKGNEYLGVLKTVEDGEEYSYKVEVIYDGNSYIWEIVE